MPALPPVPQVLKIQTIMSQGGTLVAFVHDFLRYTGSAPSNNDLNNVAGAISTAWLNAWAPLAPITYSITNVNVTDLTSATAAHGTNAISHLGTRAGNQLTASTSMLVNQKIARRYRGGKPRQYWPFGVAADLLTPATWTSAFLTAAAGGLTSWTNALLALNWPGANIAQIVSISYYSGTNPTTGKPELRPTPIVDPVTNHTVNIRVASQRRRLHFSA
jgi:hypothetical protein